MAIKPDFYYYGIDYLEPGKSVLEILGITKDEEITPCVARVAQAVKEAKTPVEQLKASSGLPLVHKTKSNNRYEVDIDAAEHNLRISLSAPSMPKITPESLTKGIQEYMDRRKAQIKASE